MAAKRTNGAPARPVVGWREWVALPELGVHRIKAKTDTGARTSTLHAEDVVHVEIDGVTVVRFTVYPHQRSKADPIVAEAALIDERWIRNPGGGGRRELRPVITSSLRIGDHEYPIELTLSQRDLMGFRMLLGRQALRRRFLVDPGRSFLTRPKMETP